MNYRDALTRATDQLSMHPQLRPTALPDAALLLLHALSVDRATLIAHPERRIEREDQARYQRLIERRLTFEPIQYILGEQEFYGLAFKVTPAVLIPRPETELLVEAVLTEWRGRAAEGSWNLLDVGTGSGAIAVALAHHLPQARMTAVDVSPEALAVARENAQRHGAAHIRFLRSDLLDGLGEDERFDVIASNPPYIALGEALHPQVSDHEPHGALFAGATGLEIYRRLIPQALRHLKPGGLLVLELGQGQRDEVAALLTEFQRVRFLDDLQGIARVALGQAPSGSSG